MFLYRLNASQGAVEAFHFIAHVLEWTANVTGAEDLVS